MKLKEWLKSNKITQKQIIEDIDLPKHAVSHLVTGRGFTSVSVVAKIYAYCQKQVDIQELLHMLKDEIGKAAEIGRIRISESTRISHADVAIKEIKTKRATQQTSAA